MKNQIPHAWEEWEEAWHFLFGKRQGIKTFWYIRCKYGTYIEADLNKEYATRRVRKLKIHHV
jgi:hypothetical protein